MVTSFSVLLNKLTSRRKSRRASEVADWHDFVQTVGGGEVTDPDQILDALSRYDKTTADLAADLGVIQQRRELQEIVAGQADAQENLAKLESQKNDLDNQMRATRDKWRVEEETIDTGLAEVRGHLDRISDAHRRLHIEADPAIRSELDVVESERSSLLGRRDYLRRMLGVGGTHQFATETTTDGQEWRRVTITAQMAKVRTIRRNAEGGGGLHASKVAMAEADTLEAQATADEKRLKAELAAVEKKLAQLGEQHKKAVEKVVAA